MRNEDIRGVQFDSRTLALADELCQQRGMSRSELLRWLVKEEAARQRQISLPGFGSEVGPVGLVEGEKPGR